MPPIMITSTDVLQNNFLKTQTQSVLETLNNPGTVASSIRQVGNITAGEGRLCAASSSSDDTYQYLKQFQNDSQGIGANFHQGSVQKALLADDTKRLRGLLLRKATVQAGKKFILESTLTKKDDAQKFSWKYERADVYVDDDIAVNDDVNHCAKKDAQYHLMYTTEEAKGVFLPLAVKKGSVSAHIQQENIVNLKNIEENKFQSLCEQYGIEQAKREIAGYEWRYIDLPDTDKRIYKYEKNSTQGRPVFDDSDGLFPSFLKLDVLTEMLKLESLLSVSAGAAKGSCAGFSAQWLDLIIGGMSKLFEIEAALEKKKQLYGGVSSNKTMMTVAQRRMAILSSQSGREAAQYQQVYRSYNDHRQSLVDAYNRSVEPYNRSVVAHSHAVDTYNRSVDECNRLINTINKANSALYEAKRNARPEDTTENQKRVQDARKRVQDADIDYEKIKKIHEKNKAQMQIAEIRSSAPVEESDAELLHFSGLKVLNRIDYSDSDPVIFMQDLASRIAIGSGAKYSFGYSSNKFHGTAFFRPDKDTVIFFDPNHGEYHVPTDELGTFLVRFFKYQYECLPFQQTLLIVAADTKLTKAGEEKLAQNDLRSLYSESKRTEKREQLALDQIESEILWKKNKQGKWVTKEIWDLQHNSVEKSSQLSTSTLVSIANKSPAYSSVTEQAQPQVVIDSSAPKISSVTQPVASVIIPITVESSQNSAAIVPSVVSQRQPSTQPVVSITIPTTIAPLQYVSPLQRAYSQLRDCRKEIGPSASRDKFWDYIERKHSSQALQAAKAKFANLAIEPNTYFEFFEMRDVFMFLNADQPT